ncbi:hypothetical protein [Streptomyces sp. NPDC005181]|uniref:hypothetical protein n=1 Tax=Streptomyces sp. NPDC005181 TaxID=3156869 RepID=UPI0033B7D7CA
MPDIQENVGFKALVAQTSAVLLTRGVEVEPVTVRDVVALMVRSVAERIGMDEEEALHLVQPDAVAEAITAAADPGREGAENVHAVRPVRVDARMVAVPVQVAGRLVMAAAQAGKYAALNGDGRTASHALDLATEIGAALSFAGVGDKADTPVGVLTELAGISETVALRVERDGWSICPCGDEHDQNEVDAGMPATLRADAALAHRWS